MDDLKDSETTIYSPLGTSVQPPPEGREPCLLKVFPIEPSLETRFPVGDRVVLLGRHGECDVRTEDVAVSRRHARLELRPDGYWLVDLGSTNGTYVNEVRVVERRLLDGDYVYLGNSVFRFLDGSGPEAAYHEEVHRLATLDFQTGVYNKRSLLQCLGRELARSARYQRPFTLVLFDIDHFKRVNDRLGHLGGDTVLAQLMVCVRGVTRQESLLARFGGEEFALLLPETSLEDGLRAAERVRQQVADYPFEHAGQPVPLTISLGVATTDGKEPLTAPELINRADQHLYRAKRAGRNRVSPDPEPKTP